MIFSFIHNKEYLVISKIISSLNNIILGKEEQLKLALACILAEGHLLIEDVPGVGKTTMAHSIANILGLEFKRLQFTSDLMPSDITGTSIFDTKNGEFKFIKGPVFNQILLADEINRAMPKTQSALLEAMEEHQVTVDNQTYQLPSPFFVIATQNQVDHMGTFELPDSQLDRFLIRISLGYPDREIEKKMLMNKHSRNYGSAIITYNDFIELINKTSDINVSENILDLILNIIDISRNKNYFNIGLSPRTSINYVKFVKAIALVNSRTFVLPEDVYFALPYIVNHRLERYVQNEYSAEIPSQLIKKMIKK